MHTVFSNKGSGVFHRTASPRRFPRAAERRTFLRSAGVLISIICFLGAGCSCLPSSGGQAPETRPDSSNRSALEGKKMSKGIKLVSWNVETFFDAATEGCEYEEFRGSDSAWNADRYRERLKRLTDYMKDENADIYCFMEIENEAVVLDISNQLQGSDAHGTRWKYAAFGKEPDTAIGCAVFSKLPLSQLTMHQIDYRISLPATAFERRETGTPLEPPVMRPLLEIRLNTAETADTDRASSAETAAAGSLTLFVCHWKSMSGGEEESAVWRGCQEALLASRMEKALSAGSAVLACGDCNRGLSEFLWSYQEGFVELRGFSGNVTAASPWFSCPQQGSYYYQGEWNRLDHMFAAGSAEIQSFRADTGGDFVKADGTPYGYSVSTGKGWSDHLPLVCTFTVSAQ